MNMPEFKLRYPSDLAGEEWAHIEALIPAAKHGGTDVREVVNGNIYVLSTGCQWRYVPKELYYFDLWTSERARDTRSRCSLVRQIETRLRRLERQPENKLPIVVVW